MRLRSRAVGYACFLTILFCSSSVAQVMGFTPPGAEQRMRAIGPLEGLAPRLKRAFEPDGDFAPIPTPRPGDWLAEHPEPGQTYEAFVALRPNRPDGIRRKIYLQPLGVFAQGRSPSVERLRAFASAFFMMDVEVTAPVSLSESAFAARINPYTGNRQICTLPVLEFLRKRLPRDAFCMLGITMQDLYPEPSWNFVFGHASLRERVGVFSFARYDPAFYGDPRGQDYRERLLKRSCKVLAHESAHMFSMQHCVFFRCVMNGSNHLRESDERPLVLCPVCLRKLRYAVGFDPVERYDRLLEFYREQGFRTEARWVEARIRRIQGDGSSRGRPP